MGRVLNLLAFVILATSLFMRSVDPVIPQIAGGLNVTPAKAALLSTAFTLPYALIQPLLGALADMFSKARLIAVCPADGLYSNPLVVEGSSEWRQALCCQTAA